MREAIEEIGKFHGALMQIKATIVAFGSIVLGVVLAFWCPAEIREEISIHRELGVGVMVFGTLFALALFADTGPGSIGQRAKSLLLGTITGAMAALAVYGQFGPQGSISFIGMLALVICGPFSLFALWEVISGKPDVTRNP